MLDFLIANIAYWPLCAFVVLCLAGFNIPFSEDAVIILSVGVCHEKPELLVPTIICMYLGIIVGDSISYWIGFLFSKGLIKIKKLKQVFESGKAEIIQRRLERRGFFTFITTRFVPFGVRNVLFLSAGFIRLNFLKFMLFDYIAAAISSQTLFWLVYVVGDDESSLFFKILGICLLVVVICFAIHNIIQIRRDCADK